MSAVFGTIGETHVTSMLFGPTWPKPKLVGAGTASRKRVYVWGHLYNFACKGMVKNTIILFQQEEAWEGSKTDKRNQNIIKWLKEWNVYIIIL